MVLELMGHQSGFGSKACGRTGRFATSMTTSNYNDIKSVHRPSAALIPAFATGIVFT